jgi:hypothetical protein
MDPTEPIDKIEPAEPIDKIDPLDPMLRIEPEEPIDHNEPLLPGMAALSQHSAAQAELTFRGARTSTG